MSDNSDKKETMSVKQAQLLNIEKRIKELEPLEKNDVIKKELSDLYAEKAKLSFQKDEPPKDFKIAEIWVKEGQLILDASPEFWMDKLRALGVLEMCKDIVKNFNKPQPKVSLVDKMGFKNFVGGLKKKRF